MNFKTDLHIHTSDVSQCAKINTEELVEELIALEDNCVPSLLFDIDTIEL